MTITPISVAGDCSLRAVGDLHTMLQGEFLQSQGEVVVDMAAVEDIDVTFIQLMVSAAKTAAASDRAFSIVNVPAPIAAGFAAAGVPLTQFASRA